MTRDTPLWSINKLSSSVNGEAARDDRTAYIESFGQNKKSLLVGDHRTTLSHRRLGYLNFKALRLLSHLSDGIVLDNYPIGKCEICIQSNATRNPFPPSTSHASKIKELTHADICSVGVPTILGGHTMFLILTDDATRFSTIYLLNHKDEAAELIIGYDKRMLIKTGRHLTVFRSDGGGEFFPSPDERILRRKRYTTTKFDALYTWTQLPSRENIPNRPWSHQRHASRLRAVSILLGICGWMLHLPQKSLTTSGDTPLDPFSGMVRIDSRSN